MMAQVASEEDMDLVLAGLHLASEDDAIKTRTHIPLPVESFSARLDGMVAVSGLANVWTRGTLWCGLWRYVWTGMTMNYYC